MDEKKWSLWKSDLKWGTVLLLVFVLIGPILLFYASPLVPFLGGFENPWPAWSEPTSGEEDLANMTTQIFAQDGLVAPFEILSVLLLAALIAGVVIALRDPEPPEPAGSGPTGPSAPMEPQGGER